MKRFKYILLAFIGLAFLAACEDETKVILDMEKATPPSLVSPAANAQITLLASEADELIVFDFDKSELSARVANVYDLEVSKSATDFSGAKTLSGTYSDEQGSISVTVVTLNKALLALGYEADEEASVYVRIKNRILDSNLSVLSDVVRIYVTPYLINADGTTDDGTRIYMVGAAVPAGWNPSDAVEMVNIGPDTYRATTTFSNERFRFLGQKDWNPISYNYPFFTSVPADYFENARQPDREDGDENLWFKGEPGEYVITVNLDTKTITIMPAPTDGTVDDGTRIYMVGAAVPAGWSPGDAVEMVNIAPNVYRATTTFSVDRFRFLGQKDWNPVSYNFPYFTGYVSNMLENARQPDREDGDQNLWFKGPAGTYVITVDLEKKSIVIDLPYSDDGTRVYIVGAAVPAGWNPGDAIEMKNIAPNRYRATTTFSVDRFRFLGQKDWGPVSYNFPYFTTVPAAYLENARQPDREDGDENIWFKGTPGEYTMTIDLAEKWIVIF